MRISHRESEGVIILRPTGRLTLEEIGVLENQARVLMEEGHDRFVLNMIDVRDLSSSGIQKILIIKRKLEGKGGSFALSELSPVASHVLDLADLTSAFHIFPTDQLAIDAVKNRERTEY